MWTPTLPPVDGRRSHTVEVRWEAWTSSAFIENGWLVGWVKMIMENKTERGSCSDGGAPLYMQHLCNVRTISQASTCLQLRTNLWACPFEAFLNILLWRHCVTLTDKTLGRRTNVSGELREFSFDVLWSSSLPERVDESNQWPENSPGWPQCKGGGGAGVKRHTLENELLSFNPKSHMMGKQWSGTMLWQRLVSDFSLTTTTHTFSWFWVWEEQSQEN